MSAGYDENKYCIHSLDPSKLQTARKYRAVLPAYPVEQINVVSHSKLGKYRVKSFHESLSGSRAGQSCRGQPCIRIFEVCKPSVLKIS